jgi:HIRAN domain
MNWIEHICEPRRLILAWQAPDNLQDRFRWAVGEIKPDRDGLLALWYFDGQQFELLNQGKPLGEVTRLGYRGYPGFRVRDPVHMGVREAFMRRLPPPSRADFADYKAYFRLKPDREVSDLALLGYTEGKLASDGFSLVNPLDCDGDRFDLMIEIAGYRYYMEEHPPVHVGQSVAFKAEPTNEHDPNAVLITAQDQRIGYVNRLQAPAFLDWLGNRSIYAVVERINGTQDRPRVFLFIKVAKNRRLVAA